MNPPDYSLQELAALVGMEPRTIRSYIHQGLLRGPDRLGRNARYSAYHLQRLQAIRVLRDSDGLSLGEIRQTLVTSAASDLERTAARLSATPSPLPSPSPSRSALAYLQSVKATLGGDWALGVAEPQEAPPSAAPTVASGSPLERVLQQLEQLSGRSPPLKARGDAWFRIPITPDLELQVRGVRSAEELARLERLADHVRDLLMGD